MKAKDKLIPLVIPLILKYNVNSITFEFLEQKIKVKRTAIINVFLSKQLMFMAIVEHIVDNNLTKYRIVLVLLLLNYYENSKYKILVKFCREKIEIMYPHKLDIGFELIHKFNL